MPDEIADVLAAVQRLGERMDTKLEALSARIDQRFDALSGRIDGLHSRIDTLIDSIADIRRDLTGHGHNE